MRTSLIVRQASLSIALAASVAWAHQQELYDMSVPPNQGGVQGGVYYWSAVGSTSLWQETNGKPDHGMLERYVNPGLPPHAGRVTGLQMHHVCYGTFPDVCNPAEDCNLSCDNVGIGPDCINCHHAPDVVFSYLPWGYYQGGKWVDGTREDCEDSWGGTFVERDMLLYGPQHHHDDPEVTLLSHLGLPATQCFPPNYGREKPLEGSGE